MSDQFPPYQPPSGPAPEPPPYGQPFPGYPAPGQSPYGHRQSHQGATTSMVLGIVAIVMALLNLFCCVTGVFSLVLGPIAIWMAIKARAEIDAQPSQYGNRGMAVAGLVTGAIGAALGLLTFAVILFFFGAVFSVG